ncbi:MAG: acyl-CoA dehydrogenase [Nitrospinaceae bacterium]|jgi:alkylation response protein AidB-like acyl-CoA dehydrogenase|nr:acyl-CoA dehydrogenase [Nitrospinaceae bacterium]MBT3433978.1 acyl-CoA dehydrogenase [Nitrospinaceae bacterium]MBT4093031.1 acyl-CoA dehydrogenase [Nitrospinaceae bacterium]MBT4430334.1 acyl-CoA dehydrogenase [Nitrospinaceae bacterium]MBT5368610.1 acyl-CoA dehydrogenase [Nitrospinaceae bacterium]
MPPSTNTALPFALSEPLCMLKDTVRELSLRHIAPRAADIDETERYPEDIFELLKAHDLLGLYIPEKYGGAGLGILGACVAIEEIARVCSNSPLFISVFLLATRTVELAASEAQKNHLLRGIATGTLRGSFSTTEPHAGSDIAAMRTRAALDGDEWVINGQKSFCTGSPQADFIVLAAKTDPAKGTKGMSLLLVPKDAPGLSIGPPERKMGMRGIPTCGLFFDDCRIPRENVIGEVGGGFKTAMLGFNQARPCIGARGVGLAQGCLDYALAYAKEREAFGKPISHHQAVQFMLADMFMGIEASRLLVHRAAALVDAGRYGKDDVHTISASKCFSSDVAMKAALDGVQILGGAGYMKDHPMERFMRDAKQLQIIEGTNQIQRSVIARNLLDL